MSNYTIELSKYPIAGGIAHHNVVVMKDAAGVVVKELNGLATGADGSIKPIGYLPSDKLKVYESQGRAYSDDSQTKATVFSGTQEEVAKLWSVAKACMDDINAKNISYPFFGLFGGQNGANSNSVASTLLKCMDLPLPTLSGWSPAQDIILLSPAAINQNRSEAGLPSLLETVLVRDSAFLGSSYDDGYGLGFGVISFTATGAEEWSLYGTLRNEGFLAAEYSGSGLSLHIDDSYLDIDVYSHIDIEGDGNDIDFLDYVAVDLEGDNNFVDSSNHYTVTVNGNANSINLWGLNGSVYANGWQVPYAPRDSLYDTAENIIDGYYYLLYTGDKRNPRMPTWPEPTSGRKETEEYSEIYQLEPEYTALLIGLQEPA